MSSVLEVTAISVAGAPAVTVGVGTTNVQVTNAMTIPSVDITVPSPIQTVAVEVPGMQGPPGLKNVYVQWVDPSTEDPENPWGPEEAGFIWIKADV